MVDMNGHNAQIERAPKSLQEIEHHDRVDPAGQANRYAQAATQVFQCGLPDDLLQVRRRHFL